MTQEEYSKEILEEVRKSNAWNTFFMITTLITMTSVVIHIAKSLTK